VDEKTGEVLPAAVVAERVGWCAALVRGMAARLLAERWNAGDVAALAAGKGPDGRTLPARAWMALRRFGWHAAPPAGIVVNDRVTRMAQEQAGRLLRSAAWRASLTAAVIASWPAAPGKRTPEEWDQVRAAVPGGDHVASGIITARTRQVQRYLAANGRLPVDVFDLEGPPRAAGMLLLAACDRQEATLERHEADPRAALLRVQLPVRPDPQGYGDWTWVAIPLALPPTIPAAAALHLPALRVQDGRVRADVTFTHLVPAARGDGHVIAIGADWGLSTLVSAGPVRLHPDGTITALGHGGQYRADGALARMHRLRRQGELLHAKADHFERLVNGRDGHRLARKLQALRDEARHVAARRAHLNDALAASAARWTIDQALASGATAVYVEDLRDLEARGMGRTLNTRLSQTVRGQVVDRMRHIAAEHGIAVVTVPPRGTSKYCPRCLAALRHCKSPDQPGTPGWKWASCRACGWQGDRDQGAWQRIAARGLAHQARTITDRAAGSMLVRAVDDTLEAAAIVAAPQAAGRDRSKSGPTRTRSPRRVPRRHTAPPTPSAGRVQRPGGHAHTARTPLPRAATRDQDVTTNGFTPPPRPHKARGAALGAGFHLNAHATPPRDMRLSSP
jgi:hypothetical protein